MKRDRRVFSVINTTEYNDDGRWSVVNVGIDELDALGFDEDDVKRIRSLKVGGVINDFDFAGVIVIRVA